MTPLSENPTALVGPSRVGTQEPPGRCFPARCGAAWGGYGAVWAGPPSPRAGNTACWVFTSHGIRNMVFPLPAGDFMESNLKPDQRVFSRNTRHETRITAFFSNHGSPTRDFPRFPTISRHFPAPPPPSAVLARLPGARRQPQLPPPSGLVPLRPTHNETHTEKGERSVLHKHEDFLYCVDTFLPGMDGDRTG